MNINLITQAKLNEYFLNVNAVENANDLNFSLPLLKEIYCGNVQSVILSPVK